MIRTSVSDPFITGELPRLKKKDFAAASEDFKEALKLNPSDEDAKYNYELSLRRKKKAEEQKNQTKETSEDKNPDPSKKDGDASEKKDSQKEQADSKNKERPDQDKAKDPSQGEGQGQKGNQQDRPKEKPEDLSGDLEGKDKSDPLNEKVPAPAPLTDSRMAENKAEALLENVKDDRSILLNAMKAQEKEAGKSGKKW